MTAFQKKILVVLIVLAAASPIGIYLPAKFNAGSAWGEWSAETIEKMIGFMPEGLNKTADLWKAPLPGYSLGDDKSPFIVQAVSYVISGVMGIALCLLILYGLSKLLVRKK